MSVKDELHALVDALPEREWDVARRFLASLVLDAAADRPPARSDNAAFFADPSVEELAAQQGVAPVADPDDLLGDFWPKEERLDDFTDAFRAWRREGDGA